MKLSFKTILPMLLIFTLLILLTGCFITPSDEQPGYTPGTITGTIAAPCCSTSADPVTEPSCVYPEYWCCYCENTWSLQDGVEVILTYGVTEVATTTTNEDGEYTFTNVPPPAKNYVITAYCPDYTDDRPLVKDVALKVVEGKTYDTKITDCVSTALGLVVDYLVENTTVLGPEEIVLDGVIAGIPNFYGFPEFKKLVERICEIAPGGVDLFEDEKVPDYLCRTAQEIGRKVIPDLDLGCTPGYAPGGGEGEGETYTLTLLSDPVGGAASLTGAGTYPEETLDVAVNTSANPCYTFLNWTIDLGDSGWITGDLNAEPLQVDMNGNVTLTAHFSCLPISSVVINIVGPTKSRSTPIALQLCMDECATINSVTIKYDCDGNPSDLVITDLTDSRLVWSYDDTKISFDKTTRAVCLIGGYESGVAGTYNIGVTYTDPCETPSNGSVNIEFIDCRCVSPTANAGIDQNLEVCPGADALVDLVGSGTGTGPLSYAWDIDDDDDFDDSTDQNPQDVALGATGSPHTVTLQVTNACDSATDKVIITITESALPTADAGIDQCIQLACASDVEVFFDGSGSSGNCLTYDWDFDDGSMHGTGVNLSHTYEAGTYTVTLT